MTFTDEQFRVLSEFIRNRIAHSLQVTLEDHDEEFRRMHVTIHSIMPAGIYKEEITIGEAGQVRTIEKGFVVGGLNLLRNE